MAGLSHLRDVYEKRGKDFLDGLLSKTVLINEKSDGAYFGVKRDGQQSKLNLFKKDAKIGYIDRVLSKYYEQGIKHFESLDSNTIGQLPENYVFGMDYVPGRREPLTITHIKVLDENFQTVEMIHEKAELSKWANLLQVKQPAILFHGKLSDDQKIKIQEFVFTPLAELTEKFKTHSFTKHILSVLNPIVEEGSKPIDEREIDEIVFRFEDGSEAGPFLAKLIDPVFHDAAKHMEPTKVQRRSDDYVWIIVIDLMNFIESYRTSQLRSITTVGQTQEERFISLINHIFIEFIEEYGPKYEDLDIQVPEFLKKSEFDVNLDLVHDEPVKNLILANSNYKEIYRILVNIFRKKKIKVNSPLFTDSMKANLASQINRLSVISAGDSIFENYFPSFNEFVGDDSSPGYFETYNTTPDQKRKVQKVNLLLSEFQPIHNGHIKNAKTLFEKNGVPTVFVCVHPGKSGKKFPFKKETLGNALAKVAGSDNRSIAGHVMVDDGNIETILKAIKPKYEPLTIAAEPSRIKDIALQLELAKKRSRNLNIKRDTRLIEVPASTMVDPVLSAIKSRDFNTYKEFTPHTVHSEFYNFNKELMESLNEGLDHPVITINESAQTTPITPNIIIED